MFLQVLHDLRRTVRTAVVYNDDFILKAIATILFNK
jgi:hypothetical protein